MSKLNKKIEKVPSIRTFGGGIASRNTDLEMLRRSILSCLLWEDQFYEDGVAIADRIKDLVTKVSPEDVSELAIEARSKMHLRHVPLLLAREMARIPDYRPLVADTLYSIINRPDEIAEFLAIYWKDGKVPIAKQVKLGLSAAFNKFSEYSLAKYRGEGNQISLRDAMFLVHAKPNDIERHLPFNKEARKLNQNVDSLSPKEKLFQKIATNSLTTPDTWEVQLSGGANKKETFERLMREGKLGALAFLRNLRNMQTAVVDWNLVDTYSKTVDVSQVLPFRYISAYRAAPQSRAILENMMFRNTSIKKLPGKTVLVLDISGSMLSQLSGKSDLTRLNAAGALAILAREMSDNIKIYITSGNDAHNTHKTKEVNAYRGFDLLEAIVDKTTGVEMGYGGIFLKQALDYIKPHERDEIERLIVLTDEVDCDKKANPKDAPAFGKHNYIINVASYQNGIAYSKFTHINGWSENVLEYIRELESLGDLKND